MSMTWRGTATLAALTAAALLGTTVPAHAAAIPPPASIASMGDSISRGFKACGWYVDCPSRSFSTGTDSGVKSHYLRIRAVNPAINGHNFNDAKSGAKVADMPGQAATVVSQAAAYVTILIGANDACTSSESSMTSVAAFRASLDSALATLKSGVPDAKVLLLSIPDIKRLWQVGSASSSARTVWSLFGVCQSMLVNPSSTAAADVARRDRVRQRVVNFNGQLAAACAAYGANCKYDGGAVFGYQFVLSQLSTWDYFHPNASGQAVLASISYAAGFGW